MDESRLVKSLFPTLTSLPWISAYGLYSGKGERTGCIKHTLKYRVFWGLFTRLHSAGFNRPSCSTPKAMKSQGLNPPQLCLPSCPAGSVCGTGSFTRQGDLQSHHGEDPSLLHRQHDGRGQGCLSASWGVQVLTGQKRPWARAARSWKSSHNPSSALAATVVKLMNKHTGRICSKIASESLFVLGQTLLILKSY